MIRTGSTESSNDSSAIELTPLIDIVFIVIVFLLITANAPLLKLPVNIPDASENPSAEAADHDRLVITLASGSMPWALGDNQFSSWELFKHALEERVSEAPGVSIATDSKAPVEALVNLMALLSEYQLQDVQILMRQPDQVID